MLINMTSACAQMEADVETAFDVFGAAASEASRLIDQLAGDVCAGAGDSDSHAVADWAARAAHIIGLVNEGDPVALCQCAAQAFDDPDARVRGLAWCALAEIEDGPGMQEIVKEAVIRAYMDRVVAPADHVLRRHEATSFAIMIGATTLGTDAQYFVKEAERDYIRRNGGGDAWLIESNPTAALRFLTHGDKGRRLAAIRVVARAGSGDQRACDAIYDRMISDPEPEVRLSATVMYGQIFRDSRNAQCLRRIAEMVLDEFEPLFNRYAAYCSLFEVDGRPFDKDRPLWRGDEEKIAGLREGAPDAEWPVDPDWAFVRRCARIG